MRKQGVRSVNERGVRCRESKTADAQVVLKRIRDALDGVYCKSRVAGVDSD